MSAPTAMKSCAIAIDRSADVRPPVDRGQTVPCDCGKRMIGCFDESRMGERPPVMAWHWWCGCGRTKPGGTWHPLTKEEALMDRWTRANAEKGAA